jgi:type IV secretion system protein VirB4
MNMGERDLVPVLAYLFRRIEKRLDGSPSVIILDEAWQMPGHRVFRGKIREWLKVLRKANCAIISISGALRRCRRGRTRLRYLGMIVPTCGVGNRCN